MNQETQSTPQRADAPYAAPDPVPLATLTVHDHTLLVQAVLERVHEIPPRLRTAPGERPTEMEVLDAALQVPGFDAETRQRLATVRALLPGIQAAHARLPPALVERLRKVGEEMRSLATADKLAVLARHRSASAEDDRFALGVDFAAEILRDGADSIYAPGSALEQLAARSSADGDAGVLVGAGDVATADAIGGAMGGLAGLLIGDPSAGAAAGAGGASLGELVVLVLDSL